MAERVSAAPKVMEALRKHENLDVPIGLIVEETGLTRLQVQAAITNLQKRHEVNITTVVRGNLYRWSGKNGKPKDAVVSASNAMFEQLAVSKSGDLILRSEDGCIYRAREIE